MTETLFLVILGYLLGSVPTAYLAGRLLRGIDIRHHGSGNVGGSNVWASVSRTAGVLVTVMDMGKGALAVALARSWGTSPASEVLAGLSVVCGHNWSLFLGFTGGRGVGTAMGVLALLAPLPLTIVTALALLFMAVTRDVPLGVLVGALLLFPTEAVVGTSPMLLAASAGLVLLILVKRALGNRSVDRGAPRPRILLHRLLWDRDTRSRAEWVSRRPAERTESLPDRGP